jgi:hypothetical protein
MKYVPSKNASFETFLFVFFEITPSGMSPLWCASGFVQGHNGRIRCSSEARRASTDGVGDVARGQMAVMFLDHSGVGVPEILRHYHQRHAIHYRQARPGVAQCMEGDWRRNPGMGAGRAHRPRLV